MRFTVILFSFLILLFGGYDISRGSELQRAAAAFKEGDYDTALAIFILFAEKGDMIAQFKLAKMYREGTGIPKDYKTAVKWFTLSAEQGNTFSQYHLSRLYYLGNGVPEDKVYAHMWANLASSSGFEMAQQLRQLLTEKMTSYQIVRAQELARECFKKNYKEC